MKTIFNFHDAHTDVEIEVYIGDFYSCFFDQVLKQKLYLVFLEKDYELIYGFRLINDVDEWNKSVKSCDVGFINAICRVMLELFKKEGTKQIALNVFGFDTEKEMRDYVYDYTDGDMIITPFSFSKIHNN